MIHQERNKLPPSSPQAPPKLLKRIPLTKTCSSLGTKNATTSFLASGPRNPRNPPAVASAGTVRPRSSKPQLAGTTIAFSVPQPLAAGLVQFTMPTDASLQVATPPHCRSSRTSAICNRSHRSVRLQIGERNSVVSVCRTRRPLTTNQRACINQLPVPAAFLVLGWLVIPAAASVP